MDDFDFNDNLYAEFCEKRGLELQEDLNENQPIPQYISHINERAQQEPNIIYISSDEESEDEETNDSIVTRCVETSLRTSDDDYDDNESDSSYYTADTHIHSPCDTKLDIDTDIERLDISCSNDSVRHIADSTNNVIVIEDDDSDIEFLYEIPRPSSSPTTSHIGRLLEKKRKRKGNEKGKGKKEKKLKLKPFEYEKPTFVRRPRRYLDDDIEVVPRGCNTGIVRCNECSMVTTRDELDLLSNLSFVRGKPHQPLCLGCSRLHAYAVCDEEASDIIKWLVTGKIPSYDRPPEFSFEHIMNRFRTRRKYMEERVIRNRGDGTELVTSSELFHICIESQFRCAVSGHYLYFHSPRSARVPYWAVTLDHIDALRYSKKYPVSWSKDNIQLLSAILNSIKGHVANEELIRWYIGFKNSKSITL